jgi:hypothetical protein
MRILTLAVCLVVLSASAVVLGQGQNASRGRSVASQTLEVDDEVVVTGRRLAQLRVAVEEAREHAWGLFNEINSNDDFDVRCSDETRTFSHAKVRTCRPRFETRITSAAAKEYLGALFATCPADRDGQIKWQDCMTGAYAQRGLARAQAISGEAPVKRDQFSDEIFRLAGENEQFAQAILDFYAAQQKYEAARKPAKRSQDEED